MMYDYLIVGQGIAGSTLAYMLRKKGKRVFIIDKFSPNSSSQVAAGLVNPITGRRIVKSWMADVALPFAFQFYSDYKNEIGTEVFHQMDALEVTGTIHEFNEWTRRMDEQNLTNYFRDDAPNELYRGKIRDFIKLVRITSSGWMDIPLFVSGIRNIFESENCFRNELFEIGDLIVSEKEVTYNDIKAIKIIFCEGYKGPENEFWNFIPLIPAKGEIVVIRCNELPQDFILLSGMFIVPIGDHKFRCGATYEWKFENELPTESGKTKLLEMLNDVLKVDFEIIEHTSGVRPTVKDRRPVIGMHPEFSNVGIFNGLGTKGVSLAPYFANQFVEYLENGGSLNIEVDVRRFQVKK
ncbi:MAG: FAD-binding oxidoreductase [Bacteroidetes bacterium]|nr:FAD-binding oxidoreductase [Bacteroidota bacterium]